MDEEKFPLLANLRNAEAQGIVPNENFRERFEMAQGRTHM